MREKRRKHKGEPKADQPAGSDATDGPTIVRRKVSVGGSAVPTGEVESAAEPDSEPNSEPEASTDVADSTPDATAAATTAESGEANDQFDALGIEIAAVLRQAQETAERVRTEAAEHALALTSKADADARRIVEEAEAQADEVRATAQTEIEQQWTAAAQQLEEATQQLEVAREQDRALRQDAADHLAHALAARDAGTEILEGATRQIERAEAAARDLESHADSARMEAAQIAVDLHALAEHFGSGSGVIDLRADAVPPADLADATATATPTAEADRPAPPAEA